LKLDTSSVDLDDSDNEALVSANIDLDNANDKIHEISLLDHGTFDIAVVTDSDNTDDIENIVLAGTDSVALAEVQLQAEYENMDVKSLKFNIAGSSLDPVSVLKATTNENVVATPT
jgi:hypothetical protein